VNSTLIIFILVPQLRLLMADAMDILEGKRSEQTRVWNKIQKVKACRKGQESIFFLGE